MKLNLNPIRGTNDFGPREAKAREDVRQTILRIYQRNGYQLIKTPILEHLELLENSDGGDNTKLIFKTIKRGAQLDLTKPNLSVADVAEEGLRYDLTVPLARFYCSNKENLPLPFKSIQIDEVFRADRPQRGRSREFLQCDIDVFGDKTENAEIDLLATAAEAYASLGFSELTFRVSDRRVLNAIITWAGFLPEQIAEIAISVDKIADIGADGVVNELASKGMSQTAAQKLVVAIEDVQKNGFAVLAKYGVSQEDAKRLENVISNATKAAKFVLPLGKKFEIVFDISIVRGQGYYTGTVFEVYDSSFARAIGGGGRYDKMIEKFAGVSVPAVGISMGFEPITMLLLENGKKQKEEKLIALFYENEPFDVVLKEKQKLKEQYDVSVFAKPKNMKNALDRLKNNGFIGYTFVGKGEIITF